MGMVSKGVGIIVLGVLGVPVFWIGYQIVYEEISGYLERRAIRPRLAAMKEVNLLELVGNPDDGVRATILVAGRDEITLYLSNDSFTRSDHLSIWSMNGVALWGTGCGSNGYPYWTTGADVGVKGNPFFASLRIKNVEDLIERRRELEAALSAIPKCPAAKNDANFAVSQLQYCVAPAQNGVDTRSALWPKVECSLSMEN